jgi:succinate dehydrogenase / fumarate reductase, membrane anchor subunit
MVTYRTGLARARGLGSAHRGTVAFIRERLTGFALVPLTLWGVWGALEIARGDYGTAVRWLAHPLNAVIVSLLIAVGFWHMSLGMRVIVEDYIHRPITKMALLTLNIFACTLGATLALFCVAKVAITGSGF